MTVKYEWLDEYLLDRPGAEKDYKLEWGWFRYNVRGKLFAAVIGPPEGMKNEIYNGHPLLNLKCEPLLAEALRAEHPEVLPGFYCDKRNWIAVCLDGELPDEQVMGLCDRSYRLIVEKLPKYVQRELAGGTN